MLQLLNHSGPQDYKSAGDSDSKGLKWDPETCVFYQTPLMIRIQVVRGLEPMFLKSGNCPYHLSIKSSCIKILLEPFCSSSLGVYWDQLWILLKRTFWFSRSGRGVHLGPCIFNKLPGAGPCCCTRPRSEPHGSLVCIAQRFEKKGKNLKQLLGCFLSLRFSVEPSSLSRALSLSLSVSLPCLLLQRVPTSLRSIFTSENTDDACRVCGGTKILN